jgi:L-alanine-DL-glutamate epimerase-like enolase superfamily enzyme
MTTLLRWPKCTTPICPARISTSKGFSRCCPPALSVIHPDLLTVGGILELKKVGDLAQEHGVAMAVHMAESPIACLAAVHAAAATENFVALENHSVDIPWWDDLVTGLPKPLVQNGYVLSEPPAWASPASTQVIAHTWRRTMTVCGHRRRVDDESPRSPVELTGAGSGLGG